MNRDIYGVAERWVNLGFNFLKIKQIDFYYRKNENEITPSDNADMSNEKGISPRLKLMVFN